MPTRSQSSASTSFAPDSEPLRRRLTQWRASRAHLRAPIPEPLWAEAVVLARRHGVFETARALRLGYESLKRRVSGPAGIAGPVPNFVELPARHRRRGPSGCSSSGLRTVGRSAFRLRRCRSPIWPRWPGRSGLLLQLHRAGSITLPAGRWTPGRRRRPRPAPVLIDDTPITGPLAALRPLAFHQVRRTPDEPLFDSLLAQYHYLGYQYPVGEHLKYLVEAHGRPLGCVAWSSAPRHLGARDRFIGWSPEVRRRNLRLLAYNTRFSKPSSRPTGISRRAWMIGR